MYGPQRYPVVLLAPFPESQPLTGWGRGGLGSTQLAGLMPRAGSVPGVPLATASQIDCIFWERAKPGPQLQQVQPHAALLFQLWGNRVRALGLLLPIEDHSICPLVWEPAQGSTPQSSQMAVSDITSSQGGQHAGTTDVTPAHCPALALTPGGDSDPPRILTPPDSQDTRGCGSLRVWGEHGGAA